MTDDVFTGYDHAILSGLVPMPTPEEQRYEDAIAEILTTGRTRIGDFEVSWVEHD